MRNSQSKLYRKIATGSQENQLRVIDMIQYLSGLARLQDVEKIGNIELSKGLRDLAQALRPYADCRVSELTPRTKNDGVSSYSRNGSEQNQISAST